MRLLISALLVTTVAMAPLTNSAALENNALYQWETKNGTPTYSPDPPPKGIKYIVVGADLKPLANQPKTPAETAAAAANDTIITTGSIAPPTTVTAPAVKWKPVRYANAPADNPQVIIKAKTTDQPIIAAETAAPAVPESNECQVINRERMILESQFSRAKSDTEMDDTILRLHAKSIEYGQKCR